MQERPSETLRKASKGREKGFQRRPERRLHPAKAARRQLVSRISTNRAPRRHAISRTPRNCGGRPAPPRHTQKFPRSTLLFSTKTSYLCGHKQPKNRNTVICTTTPTIEGSPIKAYKGVVTGEEFIDTTAPSGRTSPPTSAADTLTTTRRHWSRRATRRWRKCRNRQPISAPTPSWASVSLMRPSDLATSCSW